MSLGVGVVNLSYSGDCLHVGQSSRYFFTVPYCTVGVLSALLIRSAKIAIQGDRRDLEPGVCVVYSCTMWFECL